MRLRILLLLVLSVSATAESKHEDPVALNKQAVKLFNERKYAESRPLLEQALALAKDNPNFDRQLLGSIHCNLGEAYVMTGDPFQGVPEMEAGLALWKDLPKVKPFSRTVVNTYLAEGYNGVWRYADAARLFERTLPELEQHDGRDSLQVASALAKLAWSEHFLARFRESAQHLERSLAIYTAKGDRDSTIEVLKRMGGVYSESGDPELAASFPLKAIAIIEQSSGTDSPALLPLLRQLASMYQSDGKNWKADELYDRQEAICRKHPEVGVECIEVDPAKPLYRAFRQFNSGNYARALPLFREQLAKGKELGPGDVAKYSMFAGATRMLASYYERTGDYRRAAEVHMLKIEAFQRDPRISDIPEEKFDAARDYERAGETAKAKELFDQSVPLLEQSLTKAETVSPDGKDRGYPVGIASGLAIYYAAHGQSQRASSILDHLVTISEQTYGEHSVMFATRLTGVAHLYDHWAMRDRAAPLYERALAILEKSVGEESLLVADVLLDQAMLSMEKDPGKAQILLRRAMAGQESSMTLLLSRGSEEERRSRLEGYANTLDLTISLQNMYGSSDAAATESALLAVIERKGRVLESTEQGLRALRARAVPADRELLDQLAQIRGMRASMILRGPSPQDSGDHGKALASLRQQEDDLEKSVMKRVAGYRSPAQRVTLAELQTRIPPDSALVEMAVYRPYGAAAHAWQANRIMAWVIRRDEPVHAVDLGPAKPIAILAQRFRRALHDPAATNTEALGRQVYDAVFAPLVPALGDVTKLYLSPDGDLNLIPFAALLTPEKQYLLERYDIRYLTAGRDLLQTPPPLSQHAAVVFANPAFGDIASDESGKEQPDQNNASKRPGRAAGPRSADLRFGFTPLPGTAAEAAAIGTLLPGAAVFTGAKATETELKAVHSPRVLHIATHGFFLANSGGTRSGSGQSDSESAASETIENTEDPLLRSGLALACANQPCGGPDDGILTALEATTLDLQGTDLVVLSACETGVGDIVNGDGVYGLRRAFAIAGAQHQMISLWKVDDAATSEMMRDFYRELAGGASAGDALRTVQRKWAREGDRKHPFYWASFLVSGQ